MDPSGSRFRTVIVLGEDSRWMWVDPGGFKEF